MPNWKESIRRLLGRCQQPSIHQTSSPQEPQPDKSIPRRELSEQEMSWVRDILAANTDWSGIDVGRLYTVARCPCGGCKSVKLERPSASQNPNWSDRAHDEKSFLRFGFPVGSAHIQAKDHGLVQVMLFTDAGFLDWLDIASLEPVEGEMAFKPLPETIQELSREVSSK